MASAKDFDVAIVGTGPAGSSAAILLSRAGLRVGVFEKAPLPRYKTCGGGLLQRTLRALPLDIGRTIQAQCYRAELHHVEPDLRFGAVRPAAIVSMVMRDQFDHFLVREAEISGATIFSGCAVEDVAQDNRHFTLKTARGDFFARFVIGADGVNSIVAKRAGFPVLRNLIPALECELTVDEARFAAYSGAARFDLGFTPFGYGWVFPKKNHLSVGVLTTKRGSCNLNDEYLRYVRALGLENPRTEERHGFMIPATPRAKLFSVPGILLVGDAAGLVDPVTAEGISAAVRSGCLAANAIIANNLEPVATMKTYRDALSRTLLAELRVARVLAFGLYRFPRLRGWLLRRHGQRLTEYATDVMMGARSYHGALRRPGAIAAIILRTGR